MYTEDKRSKKAGGEDRRRRYTEEFKADVVAQCQREGISIARIALANGLNANLLRRWIVERPTVEPVASEVEGAPVPRFVALPPPIAPAAPRNSTIQIEITRGQTKIAVAWPADALADSALWLREVLR